MISSRSRRAFTLIELLVVISIIGILMTLLFPAIGGAMNAAKRAQAKNDATNIATAITAYETEYGRMPDVGSDDGAPMDAKLVNILAGKDDQENPRQIVFLEVPRAKGGKNGAVSSGNTYSSGWKDPWTNEYLVALDQDYNNEVTFESDTINKKVIVYSKGDPSRKKEYADKDKWIKSWE